MLINVSSSGTFSLCQVEGYNWYLDEPDRRYSEDDPTSLYSIQKDDLGEKYLAAGPRLYTIIARVNGGGGREVELTRASGTRYTFTMPCGRVTVEAAFAEIDHAELCPSADYTDVAPDAWYRTAVDYVIENGLMVGTSATTFSPEASTTRAQLVTILWRLEGSPVVNYLMDYEDVPEDAWYAEAVRWAASKGIAGGYGEGIYGPEDDITREQMALILYRYAQHKGYDTTQGGMEVREFTDYEEISDWALEGMTWAVNAGLLSGKDNGILDPIGDATRAEVAQILMNFCENIVK